tara:strand:- start:2082 stop:2264 length:183 start_codon:yes stop_codon:yes gene_type:complete
MTTLQELTKRINALQDRIEANMEAAEAGSISARQTIITCEEMKMEISDAIDQMGINACLV